MDGGEQKEVTGLGQRGLIGFIFKGDGLESLVCHHLLMKWWGLWKRQFNKKIKQTRSRRQK